MQSSFSGWRLGTAPAGLAAGMQENTSVVRDLPGLIRMHAVEPQAERRNAFRIPENTAGPFSDSMKMSSQRPGKPNERGT